MLTRTIKLKELNKIRKKQTETFNFKTHLKFQEMFGKFFFNTKKKKNTHNRYKRAPRNSCRLRQLQRN